jgi:arylsulfatase A-like enzyme
MSNTNTTSSLALRTLALASGLALAGGAARAVSGIVDYGWTFERAAWSGAGAVADQTPSALLLALAVAALMRRSDERPAYWPMLAMAGAGVGLVYSPLSTLTQVAGPLAIIPAALIAAITGWLACGSKVRASAPVLFLLALLSWPLALQLAPRITARTITYDLIAEDDSWTVITERSDAPIKVATITPSIAIAKARDGVPSIVLPPPAEVEFVVPAAGGPLRLATRAGISRWLSPRGDEQRGREIATELAEGESVRVHFQLEVDGVVVFDDVSEWRDDDTARWLEVTDEAGMELLPGQVVRLRTLPLEGSDRLAAELQAGFSRLALERVVETRSEPATPDAPNIIFVVMDTLRADRTSLGGHSGFTPELGKFAESGVTYLNAYATSPWTWPSTASLLSGMQPNTHGVLSSIESFLDSRIDTLAELLQARGYATAAIIGNPLIVKAQNFDQGFQHFRSTDSGIFVDSDVLVPEAIEWLRATAPARCFLYLHLVDPHEPHDPTPEAYAAVGAGNGEAPDGYPKQGLTGFKFQINRRRRNADTNDDSGRTWIAPEHESWMQTSYNAAVLTGDAQFGRLLRAVEELGMSDNTIIVFTSDHGEELLDHGHVEHIHSLWGELTRAPLVIAGPGVPRGLRVEAPVSNRHLMPTLAKLGDARVRAIDDFFDLTKPEQLAQAPLFFSTENGIWGSQDEQRVYGVRLGNWVLHYAPIATRAGGPELFEGEPVAGDWRLFDLAADPTEHEDLSRAQPERAAALRKLLLDNLAEQVEHRHGGRISSGDAMLEMLRNIGYTGGD